ncbi:hypothetical protein COP1_024106 [Malus domestica]
MKCWASVYKSGGDLSCIHESPPIYDRDLIRTPKDYEPILFNQYIGLRSTWKNHDKGKPSSIFVDNFRATFALDGRETAVTSMKGDDLLRIRFAADIRSLFQSPVPITYFGNCLSACYVAEKEREIVA